MERDIRRQRETDQPRDDRGAAPGDFQADAERENVELTRQLERSHREAHKVGRAERKKGRP